jgi:hypothetical protein
VLQAPLPLHVETSLSVLAAVAVAPFVHVWVPQAVEPS